MSSLAPSTIIEGGGFILAPDTVVTPQLVTLYKLSGVNTERIDTIYLVIPYGSAAVTDDVYAIRLTAPDGAILYEQPSPLINVTASDDFNAILVWSRLGNDTAQIAFFVQPNGAENFARGWANMRLPDVVLPPLSSVVLVSSRNFNSDDAPVTVQRATVTTTRDAGAVSSTSPIDVQALLVPSTTS